MLSLDDSRWALLEGGYRTPVDVRPLLTRLETDPDPQAAWDALWQELHHQGDVGPASFAAVPHLVRIHRARHSGDWTTYALVATVELARAKGRNPDVPEWGRTSYEAALHDLADLALAELRGATTLEAVRSILGLLAIVHGARTYGRVLMELTEDEVEELIGAQ